MARLNPEKAADRKSTYEIFRILYIKNGTYAGNIKKETDLSHGYISEQLGTLKKSGLVTKERQGSSVIYNPDNKALLQYFKDLWNVEPPQEFENWLPKYIESYCTFEKDSTIKRMLAEDLLNGLRVYIDHIADSPDKWTLDLIDAMENAEDRDNYPSDYVTEAFRR